MCFSFTVNIVSALPKEKGSKAVPGLKRTIWFLAVLVSEGLAAFKLRHIQLNEGHTLSGRRSGF